MTRPVQVTVLGGGSWGTTVAALAARNADTLLWARDSEIADQISREHRNEPYLGDHDLPEKLRATADLERAGRHADVLVVGVPSHGIRDVLTQVAPHVRPWIPVLSLAKGLEQDTRMRPTQVIGEVMGGHPVGLLAGPNLAREVLDGFAAAAAVAIPDDAVGRALAPLFASNRFRVYRNDDVLGSELGGVLKNIVAIAAGMAEGLGVGDNTRALVLTRGLAEMTRLGEAMGAKPRTFAGLTGLGDLIATCMSPLSRNRQVGERLARDETIDEVVGTMNQVAEGVKSARAVVELATQHGVEMPIAIEVDAVVNEGRHPRDAYRGLMQTMAAKEHAAG